MVETQGDTEWLAQEVDESSFNDRRLGRRFRELMENFWKNIESTIPFACQDWAGTKAAYLEGVKLVISDSHSGLKAAIQQVFSASWQRCRVHFMRNVLSRVSRANQSVVRAALQQVFVQTDEKSAHATWREVAGQLEKSNPAVTEMMDEAEADVLAYFGFPKAHRVKIHSTNTLERLNKEVKRRADVVGIFPNEESIMRLLGAVLTEQNEEWLLQNRYMPQHTMAEIDQAAENDVIEALPLSA
ncbi:hypothetical protein DSP73_21385 [Salmonella enterica]|nr:hypothetical protein [Salmonella enterica]ECN5820951.1 hypothetical protein [Salmonella enterica subsp. enterica serovar Infantis]EDW6859282.1 hypothetical protein [Salmonella enterica]EEJ5734846.1 hypothetical protein [Salmonella enterica]EIY0670541.1 transposase [Salmonella enterica]